MVEGRSRLRLRERALGSFSQKCDGGRTPELYGSALSYLPLIHGSTVADTKVIRRELA